MFRDSCQRKEKVEHLDFTDSSERSSQRSTVSFPSSVPVPRVLSFFPSFFWNRNQRVLPTHVVIGDRQADQARDTRHQE
jgi:hypothetical protein